MEPSWQRPFNMDVQDVHPETADGEGLLNLKEAGPELDFNQWCVLVLVTYCTSRHVLCRGRDTSRRSCLTPMPCPRMQARVLA